MSGIVTITSVFCDLIYLQLGVAAGQAVEGLLLVHQGCDGVILEVILGESTPGPILVANDLDIISQDLSA